LRRWPSRSSWRVSGSENRGKNQVQRHGERGPSRAMARRRCKWKPTSPGRSVRRCGVARRRTQGARSEGGHQAGGGLSYDANSERVGNESILAGAQHFKLDKEKVIRVNSLDDDDQTTMISEQSFASQDRPRRKVQAGPDAWVELESVRGVVDGGGIRLRIIRRIEDGERWKRRRHGATATPG
jgi:hypothetical protein